MTILKTDTTRTGQHLIGTYVGEKTFSYMSLYCVARGTTKSKIFNALFLEWMSRQKEVYTIPKLIREVVARTQPLVDKQRKKNPAFDIDEFRENLEAELLQKGIPIDYVGTILTSIQ